MWHSTDPALPWSIAIAGGDDARPVIMAASDRAEPLADPARTQEGGVLMRAIGSSIIGVVLLIGMTFGDSAQAGEDATSRPPIPSVGCGGSTVDPGHYAEDQLQVGDQDRTWVMYVPRAHDGATPIPLWLHFHETPGSASTLNVQAAAENEGFVVAAPQGVHTQMGYPGGWIFAQADRAIDLTSANPDIALVDALIDEMGARLCIDLARVYAAGWSGGGNAAMAMACVLDDRIAAVAPVAAPLDMGAACKAERAVPHLSVFGTGDPYFEGLDPGDPWGQHPIPQALASAHHVDRTAALAARHGCTPDPAVEVVMEGVERLTWPCPPGADVALVAIKDGVHSWQPGWQPVGDWYDTTQAVWEFFEQHPLPE